MDIEWAKDGETGELFIVQARPETVMSRQNANSLKQTQVTEHGQPVNKDTAIGGDAATGPILVIKDLTQISTIKSTLAASVRAAMKDLNMLLRA